MVVQFAFHIIILMIWPLYPLASAHDILQPYCEPACGSVAIPYPFGMKDPRCYADKWFEIECNTTSQGDQKPYLKSINLEVRHIYVSGFVRIMNPVQRSCDSKYGQQVINLTGSPFVYSHEENKFMAIGCNNIAFLHSNGSEVSGCVSICDDKEQVKDYNDLPSDSCHGKKCCETSLPNYLSEYNATLADLKKNPASHQCSYALIAVEYWFPYDRIDSLKDLNYAPAVLEWEILNTTMFGFNMSIPRVSGSICYPSNVTVLDRRPAHPMRATRHPTYVADALLMTLLIPTPDVSCTHHGPRPRTPKST